MCSINILAGLYQVAAQYPADLNAHKLLQSEDLRSITQHDQAEPRGFQYIGLPALQVGRGEILIPT